MSLLPLQVDADLASGRLCLPLDYCTRHKLYCGQPVIAKCCSGDESARVLRESSVSLMPPCRAALRLLNASLAPKK